MGFTICLLEFLKKTGAKYTFKLYFVPDSKGETAIGMRQDDLEKINQLIGEDLFEGTYPTGDLKEPSKRPPRNPGTSGQKSLTEELLGGGPNLASLQNGNV